AKSLWTRRCFLAPFDPLLQHLCVLQAFRLSIDQTDCLENTEVLKQGSKGARKRRRVQRDLATQNQASVRMEVDSEECHGDISTDREEKGCRCEATDSRAMGMAAPWYRRGGTSVKV
ncbi:unnamed protein product, partial [Musa acuminata var. zebrina]